MNQIPPEPEEDWVANAKEAEAGEKLEGIMERKKYFLVWKGGRSEEDDEKVAEFLKEFDVRDEEEVLEKLLEAKVNGARDCYGYARAKMMQSVVGVVVVDGVNEAVSEAGDKTINKGSAGMKRKLRGKKGHESLLGAEHKYHSEGRSSRNRRRGNSGQCFGRWLGNLTGSWRRN